MGCCEGETKPLSIPPYVTPTDMVNLYGSALLAELTSLPSGTASDPNTARLQSVCDGANGMAYGYLSTRYAANALDVAVLTEGLRAAFRIHCAAIARYLLDGSLEEARLKYDSAIQFFQTFSSPNLTPAGDITPGITAAERFGTIAYEVPPPTITRTQIAALFDSV